MTTTAIKYEPDLSKPLLHEIMERSGQNLPACYQCRRCAAGCPVGVEAGVTPDRLIRMILLGDREEAMNNLLVWKCLSCFTCGARCPNNIQTARITETLKQMAKEAHTEPLLPKVAAFHNAFMKATSHFGRFNEVEFMGIYELENTASAVKRGNLKIITDEIKASSRLGLAMIRKRRLHFRLARVRNLAEVKALYKKSRQQTDR
ncbi:MAG: 4Fe-4S dicluster domain-containing protein [Nitrospirae bacterium]|nr:4Fe-4S dicluster domain-containing protein [Nitrospirota bacterium]